jgi:hypothetical protein
MKLKAQHIWLLAVVIGVTVSAGCNRNNTASSRSDAEIAAEVQNRINADANLPNKQITVNTSNGVVTLSGTVGSETERLTAGNDASTVTGVKTVVNNLQISSAQGPGMGEPIPSPSAAPPVTPQRQRATTTRGASAPSASSIPNPSASHAAPATSAPAVAQVTVPAGTTFSIRTNDTIDSETAQVGDSFSGVVDDPIYVDNEIAIPRNADVTGKVVDVKSAGKFKGQSELTLALTSVAFNGKSYQLNTDNWNRKGASRGKNTAAKVGGGAAIGAIIGGIAGGGKGAAIGAGVGAGVGTGAQAVTKGQQIQLKPETALNFTLEAPVKVTPSAANRSVRRTPSGSGEDE